MESNRNSVCERPVFVVGALRSGTTMLRLMLHHHPQMNFDPGELEFVVCEAHAEGSWPELRKFYDFLETDAMFNMFATPPIVDKSLTYPELVRSFFSQCHQNDDAAVVGSVVHSNFHRLPELWPKAKYVHIIRDPRDVALSCVKMGWAGNAFAGVDTWMAAERRWDQLKRRIPEAQYLELTYEQLVTHPTEQLERICRFVGLEYHPAMLSYPETSTYDAPDPRVLYGWRKTMGSQELRQLESKAYDLLISRGYAPSETPPLVLTQKRRAVLALDNRVRRAHRSIEKLGLLLWLAHQVTRCGPQALKIGVARRMNAIRLKELR